MERFDENTLGNLLAPDIADMLARRQTHEARAALMGLMNPEISDVLMLLEPAARAMAFRVLPRDRAADVFTFLPADIQEELLEQLNNEQLAHIINEMDPDDRADLLDEMPGQVTSRLLALMRPEERQATQVILGYPPESIGRLMTPDYLTLRPQWTVQQALDHIREHGRDAETFSTGYVVDDRGRLLDDMRLRFLLLATPQATIESLMDNQVASLQATDDREEAVRAMERYDRPVLPVVDRGNVLVGIVTFDDVADVAEEEFTEDIQKLGGMQALADPYLSVPLMQLVRKRGVWLTVLFLGQTLTATAMGYFEDEIAQAAVLALFIPLIISSGGNSGSQATSLIIRALAVGEITLNDWLRVLRREMACGAMLGTLLGVIGMLKIVLASSLGWGYTEHFMLLGVTICTSLVGVVLYGSLVGAMLPFALKRLGLDPATSSAPFVATLVDVVGVVIYFTLATLFLSNTLLA